MNDNIHALRAPGQNDLVVVERMYQDAFSINFPGADYGVIARAVALRLTNAIDNERNEIVVAENDDGIIIGYVWLLRSWDADGTECVTFEGIGTHPDVRRRGVAEKLASIAVELAAKMGAKRLLARVMPHNEPVVRLIEKLGGTTRFVEYTLDIG